VIGFISGAAEPVVTEVERRPTTRTTKVRGNLANMADGGWVEREVGEV